jgi:hypothetical protein
MTTPTYTNRSNAARAARKAAEAAGVNQPLSGVHFQITESSEKPGEFAYILIDVHTGETTKPPGDDPGAGFDAEPAPTTHHPAIKGVTFTPDPQVEQVDVAALPAPPPAPKAGKGARKPKV